MTRRYGRLFLIFVDKNYKQKSMKLTKISWFITIEKGRFWTKNKFGNITNLMIFGQKAWTVDNENDQKRVDWDPLPKIKNFPNLMIFGQKAHENDQKLWFLKKKMFVFEKFENWMVLTKIHGLYLMKKQSMMTKIISFHWKLYDVAKP